MSQPFDFDKALKALQSGQAFSGQFIYLSHAVAELLLLSLFHGGVLISV
ncbi:hypothetical protein GQU36_004393 [Salmonella enterica]|nr:hypothetical protein [Salmonella enterica]